MSTSIAKNTAFMMVASVAQKVISFIYFTLIARGIGAENTGKYVLALTFTTIFVVFVDLGFTNVLVRESAKKKESIQTYLSTVLSAKLLFGAVSYIALIIVAHLLGYDMELRHLVYLSGVTMLFDSLHLSIYGVLRAYGNLKYESLSMVWSQAATLLFGSIALFSGWPIIYLILAFTIPSALNALYAAITLYKKHHIKALPSYNAQTFQYLGRIAIPFALAAIFARVYSYIDSILLQKMLGNAALGWYGTAFKIATAFHFIPLALIASLYPKMSEYFISNKERLSYLFEQSAKYLAMIAIPIAVGIIILAEDIIVLLYTSEFLPAVLPLQILMASLVALFLTFPAGSLLNACNRQKAQTTIVGVVMVANILLNLFLIPRVGLAGAALAGLLANTLYAVLGWSIVPQITRVSFSFIGKTAMQLVGAGLFMGGVVYYAKGHTHLILTVFIGAITYCLGLFATRAVTKKTIGEAIALFKK